jgi:hypothetical protein
MLLQHKRTAIFSILLEDGKLFATYKVPVTREALAAFAERQLGAEDRLAMEATTNTWAGAGVLRPFVKEIVISNPLKVRAIAEAKIKTDKYPMPPPKPTASAANARCSVADAMAILSWGFVSTNAQPRDLLAAILFGSN